MKRILIISSIEKDVFLGKLSELLSKEGFLIYRYYVQTGGLKTYNEGEEKMLIEPKSSTTSFIKVCGRGIRLLSFVKNIDYIHYHFVDSLLPALSILLKWLKPQKTLVTVWGSDFYKVTPKKAKWKSILYRKADLITFTNKITQESFIKEYEGLSDKTTTCRFGLEILDTISHELENNSKKALKIEFGFNPESVVVALGTNASRNQNHLKIIESLANISEIYKNTLTFVVPLGYPKVSNEFLQDLKQGFEQAGILNYKLDRKFYKNSELAKFRILPDILIQLQTTDQFSGAMQEGLYAGNKVITGSWLPYALLKDKGVTMELIPEISSLAMRLTESVEKRMSDEEIRLNRNIINELSSWTMVIDCWKSLYK